MSPSAKLYTPPDNEELARIYEAKGGGVCGAACIAVLEQVPVQSILDRWIGKNSAYFRGFSPIADMKSTLTTFGYTYKYVRAHKSKTFPLPKRNAAILRIQWLQPDGTEYYWAAAGAHTHYILIQRINDEWWIYCNGNGWFNILDPFAKYYLTNKGYVSSYLELSKAGTIT